MNMKAERGMSTLSSVLAVLVVVMVTPMIKMTTASIFDIPHGSWTPQSYECMTKLDTVEENGRKCGMDEYFHATVGLYFASGEPNPHDWLDALAELSRPCSEFICASSYRRCWGIILPPYHKEIVVKNAFEPFCNAKTTTNPPAPSAT